MRIKLVNNLPFNHFLSRCPDPNVELVRKPASVSSGERCAVLPNFKPGALIFFLLILSVNACAYESVVSLAGKTAWSCMAIKSGVCPTPKPPYVGVYWQYWEPSIFIETVKSPGEYVIIESGNLMKPLINNLVKDEVTSSSSYSSLNGVNLQFNEVHLFDFPLKMFIEGLMCPSFGNGTFGLRYLSEIDQRCWRKDDIEIKLPGFIGTWGPLYPRSGFLTHFSSLVTSALTGVRAIDIAGYPIGHLVTSPLDFTPDFLRDKIQQVFPYKSECISLGDNLNQLNSMHSKDGRYVWIYWHYRECCRSIT